MDSAQTWVEALNINSEQLEQWSSLVPEGKPLLVWCLEEGHVDVDAYLAWAKERFGLPVLDNQFFSEAFVAETLEGVTESSQWSPWFFPVERWDDVTIVGCVEPPPSDEEPMPGMSFVLVDPRALRDAWRATATGGGSQESAEDAAPPEGFRIGAPTKVFELNLNLDGDSVFKPIASVEQAPSAPAASAEPPLPETPDIGEAAGGTVLNIPSLPPLPDLTEEAPPAPPAPVKKEKKEKASAAPAAPAAAVKPAAKSAPAPAPAAVIDTATVDQVLADLCARYQHAFVMKCSETKAKLYKWDKGIKVKSGADVSVDLAFPTFFRIVHKTQLPYHGYLVDSPAHREFFGSLGLKELPACVTALPIKHESQLLGVVVCVGGPEMQNLNVLKEVEATAEPLTKTLIPSWSAAA